MYKAARNMDYDEQVDSDLFRSANDGVRRALDDSAAGENMTKLAMSGGMAFLGAAIVGFLVVAVGIKVLK